MALIYCPDCGKQVSDLANACPNCGYPVRSMIQQLINDDESAKGVSETPNAYDEVKESFGESFSSQTNANTIEYRSTIETGIPKESSSFFLSRKAKIGIIVGVAVLSIVAAIIIVINIMNRGENAPSAVKTTTESETIFFSPTAHENELAYLDIETIYPEIGIFQNDGDPICKWFVCKCRTTQKSEAYVRISSEVYRTV
ncbi:MAG: zinc ribbon domain-containing protein, partial [Eubacterium sp.]|nr:zinc ribbon domain-containing protein [Eubacterium sp.]